MRCTERNHESLTIKSSYRQVQKKYLFLLGILILALFDSVVIEQDEYPQYICEQEYSLHTVLLCLKKRIICCIPVTVYAVAAGKGRFTVVLA